MKLISVDEAKEALAFPGVPFQEPPLRARTVAIIGYAETSWPSQEVWDDPAIEKWTLNHGHNINPKWDRLFEFHDKSVIQAESAEHFRGVDQWAALRGEDRRPIYMRDADPEVPCGLTFPIGEFTRYFGARCAKLMAHPYVEMAAGYMLGYAIMKLHLTAHTPRETSEIRVYGFELFDGEEYQHQRANFEFYAGWALGAGIRVVVPEGSAIFHSRGLYEYETGERNAVLNWLDRYYGERFEEMKKRLAAAKAKNDAAVAEMQTISGVMQEVEINRKMVRHMLRGGIYE